MSLFRSRFSSFIGGRWLTNNVKAIILVYHRIDKLESDPQLLTVTPKNFIDHLKILSHHYNPITLDELNDALLLKRIKHGSVVVTFDDGYSDNFFNAKPLLERYQIPATIFVTTKFIGKNKEFFWDELERIILLKDILPEKLELFIKNKVHKYYVEGTIESNARWDVTMNFYPSKRYKLYWDLYNLILPLEYQEQKKVLNELAKWSGIQRRARPKYRPLDKNQLIELDDCELIDIGSHTKTHSLLAKLPIEKQYKEILESKQYLEKIRDNSVISFSYPFGSKGTFGRDTMKIVEKTGFKIGCTSINKPVTNRSHPYCLPRLIVRDWGKEEFMNKLRRFIS